MPLHDTDSDPFKRCIFFKRSLFFFNFSKLMYSKCFIGASNPNPTARSTVLYPSFENSSKSSRTRPRRSRPSSIFLCLDSKNGIWKVFLGLFSDVCVLCWTSFLSVRLWFVAVCFRLTGDTFLDCLPRCVPNILPCSEVFASFLAVLHPIIFPCPKTFSLSAVGRLKFVFAAESLKAASSSKACVFAIIVVIDQIV